MKKFTTALLILLVCVCFVLTGCSGTKLTMPEGYANPVSNGGFVVGAGNYMYFANAFKSYNDLQEKSDNNGDKVAEYSVNRLKINQSNAGLNAIKNQDDGFDYETVINKIAGYETSNMYVVNDYLYFTTPNVHKNKENAYEFNLSSLFKIKLDGTDLKEILTTKSTDTKFYLTKDKQLLIFDDSKLFGINLKQNSTEVKTLASDVSSVVFPKAQEQEIAWLYFTRARDAESLLTGNILCKISLETNEIVEDVYSVNGETITIIAQDYGRLFYTKTGGSSEGLFSNDFSSGSSEVRHRTLTTGISDGTDFAFINCDNSDCTAFAFIYNNNLYVQLLSATTDSENVRKISTETATVQFVKNSYVYYTTSTGIYRYSVYNMLNNDYSGEVDTRSQQISDCEGIDETAIDYDGRYVYFFTKTEDQGSETKYLHRADTFSGTANSECIAEIPEDDVKETEETAE